MERSQGLNGATATVDRDSSPLPARAEWLAVVAILLVVGFAFQGSRPVFEPDEGRYTDVALTMLDGGDWLVPHRDLEHEHFTKPPLTYWALAASFELFGRNAWAARVPNALAFVLTGLLVLGLGRRVLSLDPALAVVVWATMLGPVVAANTVSTDTLLALWETLAMYAWVAAQEDRGVSVRRRYIALMWAGFGLAMLTKGPPGLLPLAAILAALLFDRDWRGLRSLVQPLGLALFITTGLGWYAWIVATRPDLAGYFLGYEVYDRLFTDVHDRNAEWYGGLRVYGLAFAVGLLPWSLLLLGSMRKARVGNGTRRGQRDPHARLLWCWVLVPLGVFLFASSRLPLYVLPLMVPLALLIARSLSLRGVGLSRARTRILLAIWVCALVGLKAYGAYEHGRPDRDAELFARQISALVSIDAVDEFAFVDAKPVYGIKLYLGRNVELVTFHTQRSPYRSIRPLDDVCHELREPERAVFLVPADDRLQHFEATLVACGSYEAVALGAVDEFRVFRVRAAP
ncbi:MAG TPA: glycosyltransferase family 39 protein [Steroidobacteraceae bacterium]|nr:glycosyltransferase family 39 protein [Steroidobacteraceae bacterium]